MTGVISTRVGYAGGDKEAPTYRDLGDHTEAIQIDYDPDVLTYEELLDVFWDSHSPTQPPWSRQYMSLILTHDAAQAKAARASQALREDEIGSKLHTEIRALGRFWRAEDYHQKYGLRRHAALMAELKRLYPEEKAFVDSTAAARLNGLVGGYGKLEVLEAEFRDLDLPENRLLELAARR